MRHIGARVKDIGIIDVPKRTVDVLIAAAASVVSPSGDQGGWTIQICWTPDFSAAVIVFIAAAAFVPFTMSPTHSRIGRRLGEPCKSEFFVIL